MSKYTGCWYPSEQAIEENGAMRIAHSFEAANEKQARARATLLFMEAFPDADDELFELRIYPDGPGVPQPASDWDEAFLFDHEWDESLGHPVNIAQSEPVDFETLSPNLRIATLVKYGTTEITKDQLQDALELTQGDSKVFESHIFEAITKTPAVAAMYPERILEAVAYIHEKCTTNKKWPEIKAVLAGWLKQRDKEREESTAPLSIVDAARQKTSAEKLRTPSGATAGGGNLTDRGEGFKHDFDSLALEVAMGIVSRAMDFDIYNLRSGVVNRAREIIKLKEKPFPALFDAFRNTPGILDYSRAMIIYTLKMAQDDIWDNAPELRGYINRTLTETNHANPSAEMVAAVCGQQIQKPEQDSANETKQNAAGEVSTLEHDPAEADTVESQQSDDAPAAGAMEAAPSVERTGPFYYRTADGQPGRANKLAKLEAVIEQGCIEITKEEYQALKEAPPVQQQASRDQPGINNLGNGRFSIEGLAPEQPQTDEKSASNEVEKTEVAATQPPTTTFQSIGAALEHDLAEKGDNMKIWRSVMRTDPRYTKDLAGAGFEGTSINAEYMIMRATEIFGPIGTGWGFEVLEDRMLPGAPMSEAIYEDKKFIGNRLLRDGDGTLITEQNHSIKIVFWYLKDNGVAERFEAYGATKYLYKTKHGITCDGEAQKKSLTDAIKKALSLLGFSADVWLGLYDQAEYKQENATEFAIKNASEKAEDVSRLRNELDEKLTRVANTIENAVSPNEAKKVFDTLAREVEVHRKAAEAKGDTEHAKYLSGRLRRLSQIKDQRINALTENQEQSA